MKKLLITGSGGFIGSHLTELCVQKGYQVKAFLHYNSSGSRGWLEDSDYKNDIEFIQGDVRDYDSIYKALKNCDAVFHLAALIGIPYSYVSPLAYIKTNVEGTYNVLEAARHLEIQNILLTSTSETYGSAQYVPIDEKHPANAQSPYAASKVSADQLALSYHRSFNLPVKIVRPFNTFGPRQSARAIIPTIISQLLVGKEKLNLGNTTPTRDFTYVKDTVAAFLEIARTPGLHGEVLNIGMNEEISIKDLVKLIGKILNQPVSVLEDRQRVRPAGSEVNRLICQNKRILKLTKWKPKYTLQKGLSETIEFIKSRQGLYKADIYNI